MRLGKIRKIHFVGIGGIGMSGIAELLLNLGYQVSGSDLNPSEITRHLEEKGARIFKGHAPEHVRGTQVLVYSSAVTPDNVEIQEALRRKIPVIKRAEMLAELMRLKHGIAIAGTHGKTTTTSMTGAVLTEGGLDPTLIIGGKVKALNTNAKLGSGDFLVAEADEFDRSFLFLVPTIAVITNVEPEHLDSYRDYEDLKDAFVSFANKVPFYGKIIACLDDRGVQEVLSRFKRRVETYGFSSQADLVARHVRWEKGRQVFQVFYHQKALGTIRLQVPGAHNVLNALAAVAVGLELDVPFRTIQQALADFTGVNRRFEIKAEVNGILLVDDYAHHPTEIQATLEAARTGWPERRIVAVFQPHLYSRTQKFYREFARSFLDADVLFVLDVYPAREAPIEGVSGRWIADAAVEMGHRQVFFVEDKTRVAHAVAPHVRPGDMIITIGAGDVWRINQRLLDWLTR